MAYEILILCRERDGELIPQGVALDCVGTLFSPIFPDVGAAWAALSMWRADPSQPDDQKFMESCAEKAAALPICDCESEPHRRGRIVNGRCNFCQKSLQAADEDIDGVTGCADDHSEIWKSLRGATHADTERIFAEPETDERVMT